MFSKLQLVYFLLFVYENFIYEDWSMLKRFAVPIIKPFWYIKNILAILFVIATFVVLYPAHYYISNLNFDVYDQNF